MKDIDEKQETEHKKETEIEEEEEEDKWVPKIRERREKSNLSRSDGARHKATKEQRL